MSRRPIFSILVGVSTVGIVALALLVSGAPSAERQSAIYRTADEVGTVYKVSVRAFVAGHESRRMEWISPSSGAWRFETGGRVYVYFDGNYYLRNEDGLPYLRSGSARFLGSLATLPFALEPVRAYVSERRQLRGNGFRGAELHVASSPTGKTRLIVTRSGSTLMRVTIEDRLTPAQASEKELFEISADALENTEREVALGRASSLPVKAYWFGRTLGDVTAVTAVERKKTRLPAERLMGLPAQSDVAAHITLYVPRTAGGRSSAIPDQPALEGEIKVVSEPIDSAHAQGAVAAMNGRNGDLTYAPFPRFAITLADGEKAVVIPDQFDGVGNVRNGFYVLTRTTLVSVAGLFTVSRIREVSPLLKPL